MNHVLTNVPSIINHEAKRGQAKIARGDQKIPGIGVEIACYDAFPFLMVMP
jgi:hypothetical protein